MNQVSSSAEFSHQAPADNGMRALWLAVLEAAMQDAEQHGDNHSNINSHGFVRNSLRWFDSKRCREICNMLGLEWEYVRARAHQRRNIMLNGGRRKIRKAAR
jgi:hypothetical protein